MKGVPIFNPVFAHLTLRGHKILHPPRRQSPPVHSGTFVPIIHCKFPPCYSDSCHVTEWSPSNKGRRYWPPYELFQGGLTGQAKKKELPDAEVTGSSGNGDRNGRLGMDEERRAQRFFEGWGLRMFSHVFQHCVFSWVYCTKWNDCADPCGDDGDDQILCCHCDGFDLVVANPSSSCEDASLESLLAERVCSDRHLLGLRFALS